MSDYFSAHGSAIYSRLSSTAAITNLLSGTAAIYYEAAPDDPTFPYIVWSWLVPLSDNISSVDTRDGEVSIRAYEKSSSPLIVAQIDDAIDDAMQTDLAPSGWEVFWQKRTQGQTLVERPPTGEIIHMMGGQYQIRSGKT